MFENIGTKPLSIVLIITAHTIFVQSRVEVNGTLGGDVRLNFTFNISLTKSSHFAVYLNKQKVAEYLKGAEGDVFIVCKNTTTIVSWLNTNLSANASGKYLASVFRNGLAIESSPVELTVQEGPRSSTGSPVSNILPNEEDRGSSSVIVILLVVSPVVLLVAVLPCLIWCLVRGRDKQQEPPPPQSAYPTVHTVQERVEASKNVPGSSLVYSVLDFPKRPSAVLEVNLNDTEYAAVSYLSENRKV